MIELNGYAQWRKWNLDIRGCLKADNLYSYFKREVDWPTVASGLDGNEASNGFIENLSVDTISTKIASLARVSEYDTFPEIYHVIEAQLK